MMDIKCDARIVECETVVVETSTKHVSRDVVTIMPIT